MIAVAVISITHVVCKVHFHYLLFYLLNKQTSTNAIVLTYNISIYTDKPVIMNATTQYRCFILFLYLIIFFICSCTFASCRNAESHWLFLTATAAAAAAGMRTVTSSHHYVSLPSRARPPAHVCLLIVLQTRDKLQPENTEPTVISYIGLPFCSMSDNKYCIGYSKLSRVP